MHTGNHIDPLISFRNSQGEHVRGTLVNLQRKSLVMELYNPHSIVQVSEVLLDLAVRCGERSVYHGKAVVTNILTTGLTAIVSVTLTDEWQDLNTGLSTPKQMGEQAIAFLEGWSYRFRIRREYQLAVNDLSYFLSDMARWVEQVDLTDALPKQDGRLRDDYFQALAAPLMEKSRHYLERFEHEAAQVAADVAPAHRAFAQAALHPLLLRAPFLFRSFTKPLGYAGDYQMINQMLDDPRQGPNTYFQIVNTLFLQADVAAAHRNRVDLLFEFLCWQADAAGAAQRTFRILNVGCGPATEIQRFLLRYPHPERLSFELIDFNEETLGWTGNKLDPLLPASGRHLSIQYSHDSVHTLLKRGIGKRSESSREFDAVYCAGLFDYLSDKVCLRLNEYFASRIRPDGRLLVTNMHQCNPERFRMEHLLEWHIVYRDEVKMRALLPSCAPEDKISVDATGIDIIAEAVIP